MASGRRTDQCVVRIGSPGSNEDAVPSAVFLRDHAPATTRKFRTQNQGETEH